LTDSPDEARRYSIRLLSYRARSEKEIRDRLKRKGFSGKSIESAVPSLKESGFIDDVALARQLRRQAIEVKLLGYGPAKAYMIKRGVPAEIIEETLDRDEDEELRNAQKIVDKKLKTMGNYLTADERKKLWNFLARRGYSFGTIRKALKDAGIEEAEE
jgi:regulatory protein